MRLLLFLLMGCATAHAECPASGTQLVVEASARRLQLCDGGVEAHSYRVSLGRGGLDKHQEGDRRTPVGEYPLAAARPSTEFHTFLPVGYPTAEQSARGMTGGDIGVHGPKRRFRFLRSLATLSNWTAGCIAVASDAEIDEIAAWVKDHGARSIVIRK